VIIIIIIIIIIISDHVGPSALINLI